MNDAAYAVCFRLARQHDENFPVASLLLPKGSRRHIAAIYAFARIADDFVDEGERTDETRMALLEEWQWRLHSAVAGRIEQDGSDASHVFTALAHTIATFKLEMQLFEDLLSAFFQDLIVKRYNTWDDLLDYCRRSANPIGRLTLRVAGFRDPILDEQSDAVCTALQLTNFWQDLAVDWEKNRVYLPQELLRAAGADEADLAWKQHTPEWRTALSEAATRTRALFLKGRPVVDGVQGRLRWELRATWLGGMRVLDRLEATEFDIFNKRPTLSAADKALVLWRTARWNGSTGLQENRGVTRPAVAKAAVPVVASAEAIELGEALDRAEAADRAEAPPTRG